MHSKTKAWFQEQYQLLSQYMYLGDKSPEQHTVTEEGRFTTHENNHKNNPKNNPKSNPQKNHL